MGGPAVRVVIAGSSGLIGRRLVAELTHRGAEVVRLVRSPGAADARTAVLWDPAGGRLDPAALEGSDAVVNLAGRSIAGGRWTTRVKRELEASRIGSTRTLVRAMAACGSPPRLLINASAVGFYGDRGDELLDESSPAGAGFLAGLAAAWEAEAVRAGDTGARVVLLRLGMVVARGGALARMLPAFRLGLGGPVGSGRQWWPWIAMDDVVGAVLHALDQPGVAGPVNLVSPCQVRSREFAATVGRVLRRPAVVPLPAFAARLALGEMADGLLLASARVRPAVLESAGYAFEVPSLDAAIRRAID